MVKVLCTVKMTSYLAYSAVSRLGLFRRNSASNLRRKPSPPPHSGNSPLTFHAGQKCGRTIEYDCGRGRQHAGSALTKQYPAVVDLKAIGPTGKTGFEH